MPIRFPPLEEYKAQYKARLDRQIEDLKRRGRYYVAAPRPKGYRLGRPGRCFYNAAMAAVYGKGKYVEGLFYRPRPLAAIPHAWITTDGRNAIELTLRGTEGVLYFGVEFDTQTIARAISGKGYVESQLGLSMFDFWPFAPLS